MNSKTLLVTGCFFLIATPPALAHHSFAMFANNQVQTLSGTVKGFEWINPHAWIHLVILNSAGKPEDWSFEMGGPGQLSARGWNKDSVKAGDKVTITFHPMLDGSHGGSEMSVKLPNGTVLGGGPGAINTGGPGRRGLPPE